MKNFIKGSLFVLLIIPIVDCIITILQQLSQHICTLIAKETYNVKKNIEEEEEEDSGNGIAIGFQTSQDLEEYEEDEDE